MIPTGNVELGPRNPAATSPPSPAALLSPDERAYLWRLIRGGLLLRVVLALALEWTGYSVHLAPDEETYYTGGWYMALHWNGQYPLLPEQLRPPRVNAYFYIVGATIFVFGLTQVWVKLFNCVLGAVACRYQYFIARDLFGPTVARRSAFLMQFFPSLVLWSTLNIRDTCVIFLILMAAWYSLLLIRAFSFASLFKLVLAVWLITRFRDYLFLAIALPVFIALVVGRRGKFGRNVIVGTIAGLLLMLLLDQSTTRRASLEAVSDAREGLATGGSAFHRNVDVSTPAAALTFLPSALIYYFFSPFPWQITTVLKSLSLPEMLIVYWLTPATLRGLLTSIRTRLRECLIILLMTAFLTIAYAVGEGNVGTLYRHRAQTVPFYLMFAAFGVELARRRAPGPAVQHVAPHARPATG
jgi:hypothetical protein